MPRPRTLLILALVVPLVGFGGWAGCRKWNDFDDRHGLFVGCHSDRLNHVAHACELAATANGGLLPAKADIVTHLDSVGRDWFLTCAGCDQPFVWNNQVEGIDLRSADRIAVAWCPPDSHGRHVGVVVVQNGDVEQIMLTDDELHRLRAK